MISRALIVVFYIFQVTYLSAEPRVELDYDQAIEQAEALEREAKNYEERRRILQDAIRTKRLLREQYLKELEIWMRVASGETHVKVSREKGAEMQKSVAKAAVDVAKGGRLNKVKAGLRALKAVDAYGDILEAVGDYQVGSERVKEIQLRIAQVEAQLQSDEENISVLDKSLKEVQKELKKYPTVWENFLKIIEAGVKAQKRQCEQYNSPSNLKEEITSAQWRYGFYCNSSQSFCSFRYECIGNRSLYCKGEKPYKICECEEEGFELNYQVPDDPRTELSDERVTQCGRQPV